MSENVVVRCPKCSQKYRITLRSVGHRARCKVCGTIFAILDEHTASEDDIVSWITDDDPSSRSVMGSTGIFQADEDSDGTNQEQAVVTHHAIGHVILHQLDGEGAFFDFAADALADPALRNAFSRKCVGCGARKDLNVNLIYWPERMIANDAKRWKERMGISVGRLEAFKNHMAPALLNQLPRTRHLTEPFNLPFPIFSCHYCPPSQFVEGHVLGQRPHEVCRLRISFLGAAVSFFRNSGGRTDPAYRRLVEERDRRRDPWIQLDPELRLRISQWFTPDDQEHFVRYFRDLDFERNDLGKAGLVLTDRRLIFKKMAACRDYPLDEEGRLELVTRGDKAIVHIYEQGHDPATMKLERREFDDLRYTLQKMNCPWAVVS